MAKVSCGVYWYPTVIDQLLNEPDPATVLESPCNPKACITYGPRVKGIKIPLNKKRARASRITCIQWRAMTTFFSKLLSFFSSITELCDRPGLWSSTKVRDHRAL